MLKKRFPLASLRTRLALLVFLAMLPLLGLTFFTYLVEREQVVSHIREDVLRIARFVAGDQEQFIETTRQMLVALANIPVVHDPGEQACNRVFAEILEEYPRYANMGAVNPGGHLICSAVRMAEDVDFAGQSWFQHSMEAKDFAIGQSRDEKATLNVSYPVLDDAGNIRAVLFAALEMAQINQLAYQIQLPAMAEFFMVSRSGNILAHMPKHEEWAGKSIRELPILAQILTKGHGVMELSGLDGVVRLYAFTPLSSVVDTGLFIGVGIPKRAAYSEAQKVLIHHFAGLSIGILVALLAVWYGSEVLILRPVKALVGAVERLSKDDMTARSGLPHGTGELDGLARAFDEMADTLEQRTSQLREAEAKYRTLVEQIPAITYAARLDENRSTFYISPQVTETLGFSPHEWVEDGRLWIQQIHSDDLEHVRQELAGCCTKESIKRFSCEYRIFSRDGRQLWFTDEAVKVRSEEHDSHYLQGIMRDITEQRRAQEKLLTYQQQLRSLASQLSLAEERERRRIAIDLHDHVGQALAMSRIKLGILRESAPSDAFATMVDDVRKLVVQAIRDTRSLIFKISSPILYELGFEAAVEWLVEETQRKHGILVLYEDDDNPKPLDDDIRVMLFQAVGELLVNVVKHASAKTVSLSSRLEDDYIVVEVEDDGVGFDVSEVASRRSSAEGFGLFSIRERLNHIGGQLKVDSKQGRGTHIVIIAPVSHGKRDRLLNHNEEQKQERRV
ncbi:MAG: PAS domain-containing protein [Desulforhabdus sp.]|jgi:PAS domain S-box-containing protein|nr:PAS domain-containing protein [Desulforhabdus sp.]